MEIEYTWGPDPTLYNIAHRQLPGLTGEASVFSPREHLRVLLSMRVADNPSVSWNTGASTLRRDRDLARIGRLLALGRSLRNRVIVF
jgi:hypothetical protein